MRVLVTGAGGFIGSHLTEALLAKGYDVRALTYYNSMNSAEWIDTFAPETRDKIEIVAGDVRDLAFVQRTMDGCDAVLHLAALIGIPYSYVNPESYIDTNVKGTMNIMEAARNLGVKRVVHTSTSEVYGSAQFVPITEEHPLQGQSPYSASKIGADQMAYAYAQSFDVPVVIIRPFNTFGPRQSLRAVIPTVITQLLNGDGKVKIGATTPTRDFSFVTDTAAGFIAALENNNPDLIGQTINLGSNFEISIGDTIQMIGEIIGKSVDLDCEQERLRPENSEVQRLYADNSKALKMLNWQPEFAGKDGFSKALRQAVEWYAQPQNIQYFQNNNYVV